MVLDVELFKVHAVERGADPRKGVPKPEAMGPMTIEANSYDQAKALLRRTLMQKGMKIRGINFGQNKSGRTCLIAYVHGEERP
ncbi:MAG: hypothetical protein ACYSUI_10800 [Planctomycetota bacterium]|jgi:hypothetical protein